MNHADLPVLNSMQAVQAAIDRDPELKARQVDQLNEGVRFAYPLRKTLCLLKQDLLAGRSLFMFHLVHFQTGYSYAVFQVV
jgi:hypothetical protein